MNPGHVSRPGFGGLHRQLAGCAQAVCESASLPLCCIPSLEQVFSSGVERTLYTSKMAVSPTASAQSEGAERGRSAHLGCAGTRPTARSPPRPPPAEPRTHDSMQVSASLSLPELRVVLRVRLRVVLLVELRVGLLVELRLGRCMPRQQSILRNAPATPRPAPSASIAGCADRTRTALCGVSGWTPWVVGEG